LIKKKAALRPIASGLALLPELPNDRGSAHTRRFGFDPCVAIWAIAATERAESHGFCKTIQAHHSVKPRVLIAG
jgi:hypothetical protein